NSAAGRMAEIEAAGTDARADMRLAEIRAQMASEGGNQLESGAGEPAGALEQGDAAQGAAEGAAEGAAAPDTDAAPNADAADAEHPDVDDADVTVDPPKEGGR